MINFPIHDIQSAPEKSKPLLEESVQAFKMIPNLHGALAESPELLDAYKKIHSLFMASSFNKEELTVVWQTINIEHQCHYCVPAHTAVAHSMQVDPALSETLRNGEKMPTEKLQALQDLTLSIVRKRGNVSEEELTAFYNAGYNQQNVLEIILGVSQKVISNYTNHIVKTPIDKPFQQFAWEKPTAV